MKLKPRDKSQVYDKLYALAAKILNKSDACGKCPITCTGSARSKSWCCSGCPHLGSRGCTVQALGCKLWLCHQADAGRYQRRLSKLKHIADHYEIHMARASKEQSLRYGSVEDFWYVYRRDSNK